MRDPWLAVSRSVALTASAKSGVWRRFSQLMSKTADRPDIVERLRQEQRELVAQHGEAITGADPAAGSLLACCKHQQGHCCSIVRQALLRPATHVGSAAAQHVDSTDSGACS